MLKQKDMTFSVPLEKEVTRIDKNREKVRKILSYGLLFISARFDSDFIWTVPDLW